MTRWLIASILALAVVPATAHRLDEYLQGTIFTIGRSRVEAQMTLTPGVAVFPRLIATIDTNADGLVSDAERDVYAARVLRDLSIAIDGHNLTPRLISIQFPAIDDMKEGRGEIRLDFEAELPPGSHERKLTFENHHESGISAYQVNSLVPRDPDIHIATQNRNYSQSLYELDYEQTGAPENSLKWLAPLAAILIIAVIVFVISRNSQPAQARTSPPVPSHRT